MRYLRGVIYGLILSAAMAQAVQSGRLQHLADRLAESANNLAAESYRGFNDRDRGNRADVEALYLACQFGASAGLFRRMVEDRRPASELRDAAALLSSMAQSSSRFGFGRREWQEMSRDLDEISRELGYGRNYRDERDRDDGPRPHDRINGRMLWRGRVDDQVQIFVQGSSATPRVVSGGSVSNATANFTSPLPSRPVTVEVNKIKGRGDVDIIQQPSRDNQFTAVIQIVDHKGGADNYELEIFW